MKAITIPAFLRIFYPSLLWSMPAGEKKLYLTFDDGPHPEITSAVLDLLDQYKAKASFFCVGENVLKFPETYHNIIERGHVVGNHGFNHLNGWKTPLNDYYENINFCKQYIVSNWFRPPYGRITPSQIQALKKEYTIVMWTVLSYDYDNQTTPEMCVEYVLNNCTDGAIIVFHDSEKAAKNMLTALPIVLETFTNQGFTFHCLH